MGGTVGLLPLIFTLNLLGQTVKDIKEPHGEKEEEEALLKHNETHSNTGNGTSQFLLTSDSLTPQDLKDDEAYPRFKKRAKCERSEILQTDKKDSKINEHKVGELHQIYTFKGQ